MLQGLFALLLFFGAPLAFAWLVPAHKISMLHTVLLLIVMKVGVLMGVVAVRLRKFQPWARTAAVVFCVIGLLVIPLGTLICGPFLYVLVKGKHLFAPESQPRHAPGEVDPVDRLAA